MSGLIDLDEIAGAKATHKFARLSASKARVVLDLIRDEALDRARDILEFCDRGAADVVTKVLNSAVSNAENNESLSADELYVAECWADEGPTLKRWRFEPATHCGKAIEARYVIAREFRLGD